MHLLWMGKRIVIKEASGRKPDWCEYYPLSKWKKNDKTFKLYKHTNCYFLKLSILIIVKNSDYNSPVKDNLKVFIHRWWKMLTG